MSRSVQKRKPVLSTQCFNSELDIAEIGRDCLRTGFFLLYVSLLAKTVNYNICNKWCQGKN